ncbi:MAG: type III secretion system stator protein SctL [Puniceicoccales bacterium]|nr:type III secretion system stator protein SctL [Puniceicoccales bacterium]
MAIREAYVAAVQVERVEMWVFDREKKCEIAPGKRVLRAEEFLAICGTLQLIDEGEKIATDLIAQANAQAKEIIKKANADAQALKDSTQAAFEAEKKKGFEAGAESGKKEMAAKLMEITAKNVKRFANLENVILEILMIAMRRIFGEMDNAELVRRIAKHALQVVRNQKKAILRVHPDQAKSTREGLASMSGHDPSMPIVEVVADGRLAMNSCLIETEVGVIDASLEVQMTVIRKVLEKTFSALQ